MIRVLYAGSPAPAARTLEILYGCGPENGFEIAGVLTNPPSPQGRHKTLIPTPVAQFAAEHNIPLFEPEHLDAECRHAAAAVKADIIVCFAYGHIFGPKFMQLFRLGGINLHPSLLPKYRGSTPVQAAILNRDKETAFTIQKLAPGMDEGDILAQEIIGLNGTETAGTLLDRAAEDGGRLFAEVLKAADENGALAEGIPQQGEPSYTGIITKNHGKINWNNQAEEIDAAVRAYAPEPGCWTSENGTVLKILAGKSYSEEIGAEYADEKPGTVCAFDKKRGIIIRCGSGFYCAEELQRQGKKPMKFKDFMNGARGLEGTVLG